MMAEAGNNGLFLIFDNSSFGIRYFKNTGRCVTLFPLAADWKQTYSVKKRLNGLNIEAKILDATRLINEQAALYREKFIEWTGSISNFNIDSKPLHKCMLLSDKGVSAWWFGLLSDKDSTKGRAFLKISCTAAILSQIKSCNSKTVILALKDRIYQKQLKIILTEEGIDLQIIRTKLNPKNCLVPFKSFLRKMGTVRAFHLLGATFLKVVYLRLRMPSLKKRRKAFSDALLFITYFPSFAKVENAEFRNKFAGPLQDLCRAYKKEIVWVLNYAQLDGYSFKDAVRLARGFMEGGEFMFFWQEFFAVKNMLSVLLQYFRLLSVRRYFRKKLGYKLINRYTGCNFTGLFFLESMDESFYGGYYLNGMIYYEAFKNIFKELSGFSHGLYTCEMMGWEYACNAAKKINKSNFPVIGYQDFTFSPYLLQMFHSKEELKFKNSPEGIPLPEIIASCGRIPQVLLEKYYHNTVNLETLRFSYLNKFMQPQSRQIEKGKGNKLILLVCTNIYMRESMAILRLIDTAYEDIKNDVEVWFKGHPALPIERVFSVSGIRPSNYAHFCKAGPLSDFLIHCDAMFAGEGSTTIEALAFGCEVLIFLNPQMPGLSSLAGFEEFCWSVSAPGDLPGIISNIRRGNQKQDIKKKQEFIRGYWNLNPSLEGWKRILSIN